VRILVVDDEARYRAYLHRILGAQGHDVEVAQTGREAIDLGIRFQPELLVTDWMLRNHLHGLHVSRVLRAIDSDMPTILMTGFSSEDLRIEARIGSVLHFIEKPFEVETLEAAVRHAAYRSEVRRETVPFGVVIADRNGFLVSISERAREMFRRTSAGSRPGRLSDLFDGEARASLERSRAEWVQVAARAPGRIRWWVRSHQEGAFRVFVLLPDRRRFLHTDVRIALLLDLDAPLADGLQAGRRLLVIDELSEANPAYLEALEQIGCVAYRADCLELGLRLFREDPEIDVVVMDCTPGAALDAALETLRELRPGVAIVGTSQNPEEAASYQRAGVTRQLHRPWRVGDLVALLQD
jgi:DNA-binding response OmpR family regulator